MKQYIGNFEINGSVDSDGHLTLWVKSTDGTAVIDFGEDVAESSQEFAVRLTTKSIEDKFVLENPVS
jgi:hypothetical protein